MLKIGDAINLIKNSKKAKRIIWFIAFVLFILLFSYVQKTKTMKIHYNNGNKAFKQGYFADAEKDYTYALWEKPKKRQECKIRINKALSIVTPITPESVTYDVLDQTIERLEYAQSVLTENDCAHTDDSNGHNKKAQKLKEEIDEYIEYLKENVTPPDSEDQKDGDKDDQDKKDQDQDEEKTKREELKELIKGAEKEGLQERRQDLDTYKEGAFSFYSGKNW